MPAITLNSSKLFRCRRMDAIEAIREIDADVRLSELHYSIKTEYVLWPFSTSSW